MEQIQLVHPCAEISSASVEMRLGGEKLLDSMRASLPEQLEVLTVATFSTRLDSRHGGRSADDSEGSLHQNMKCDLAEIKGVNSSQLSRRGDVECVVV